MIDLLARSLAALEPMLNRLVFVGRHVTGLLVTDHAVLISRPIFIEDAIVTAVSYSARDRLVSDLARNGFRPLTGRADNVPCWTTGNGLRVKVIPADLAAEHKLQPWYAYALECTLAVPLGTHLIRVAGAPAFVALELATLGERASGTFELSVELEDTLAVLNGRPSAEGEILAAPQNVRRFIAERLAAIAGRPDADMILAEHIPDAERLPRLVVASLDRLRRLATA